MGFKLFKRWVFWAHLVTGLVSGIFVFGMSFSGVLLTYERQIKELAEMYYTVSPSDTVTRISTDRVVEILQSLEPTEPHIYIRWVNREGAAIPAWAGKNSYLLHPYTGAVLRKGEGIAADFFHIVTDFHRYLSLEGESRAVGKSINAYANLVFLFLLLSGLYLWLPKRLNIKAFKLHLLLPSRYQNVQHRNRQWHLVFGIWSLPVLFVVALSATIFHFPWANEALYGAFGESVPKREKHAEVNSLEADFVPYESLFNYAKQYDADMSAKNDSEDWYSMWLEIGDIEHQVRFYIDKSIGHRQELAYSLFLDTRNGEFLRVFRKQDWSKGGQAWGTARFLHTGEYFGIVGQTIAGLASLIACILVYTGVLLAWRRLITKPFKRTQNASNG